MDAFEVLRARGFLQQCSHEDEVRAALAGDEPIRFYIGFDPTGPSLHVGNLMQLMVMSWLQRSGHHPVALIGGGTAMIGDPSGKTELRPLLDRETIAAHAEVFRDQIGHFVALDGARGTVVDNADWLLDLKLVPFLRDIGRQFSVNRMLAAEAYKQRLQRGLSFLEFNYQIFQAYDFLELHRTHGVALQIGGDDQWGNILAGVELVRRVCQSRAWALTTPLITTSTGAKMGKTASGAVWLHPEMLSPFDYWQYWYNVDDQDVGRFLRLYTFLSLEEIGPLEALTGARIRQAKRALATECTRLLHGEDAAAAAAAGAEAMVADASSRDLPSHSIEAATALLVVLADAGLAKSRGAARRLVSQGGVRIDGKKISDPDTPVVPGPSGVVVRVGKRRAIRVVLES